MSIRVAVGVVALQVWLQVLGAAPAFGARTAQACLQEILTFWEWENYWGGGFPAKAQYNAGERVHALVFWNDSACGLCSTSWRLCVLYEAIDREPLRLLAREAVGDGDEEAAAKAFLRSGLTPGHSLDPRLRQSIESSTRPTSPVGQRTDKADVVVGAPVLRDSEAARIRLDWANFQRFHFEFVPPVLKLPKAVRSKIVSSDWPAFEKVLRQRLCGGTAARGCGSCEVVVPYYAVSDPAVYVLVEMQGCLQEVVTFIRDVATGEWIPGAASDRPSVLARDRPRIVRAMMFRLQLK